MSGQSTHLDPEVLAEFRAGLITGRRGTTLAAHLAECDRCAALDADLAEVSTLFAAVPPPALPADLADRLDLVLAAEVAERNKNYSERAVVSRSRARRRPGWLAGWIGAGNRRFRLVAVRVLAPAAVVLAGLGYGLAQIGGSPAVTAAPAPVPSAFPAEGSATSQNPHSLPRAGAEEQGGTLRVAVSGTDYLPGTLSRQVQAALHGSSYAPGTVQAAPRQLRACVLRITGETAPVLVQSAHYQGQPAYVIVASRTSGDLVLVVAPGWAAPGCSATSRDVLDTATLPPGI